MLSWLSLKALIFTLAQTAFRKDEVSVESAKVGFSKVQLSRSSVVWKIGGKDVISPTVADIDALQEGDGCFIFPRPSKADYDGSFWCDKPIWLPLTEERPDTVCAARALAAIERAFPVYDLARQNVPLFANDSGGPFTHSQLEKFLSSALAFLVPMEHVKDYSWHSFRIYLACALDKAKCPHDKIKRICRWISDESLFTYIRPGAEMYEEWLPKAQRQVVDARQTHHIDRVTDDLGTMRHLAEHFDVGTEEPG